MKTDNKVLIELKEIKQIIARMSGTSDLPEEERFSLDALDKAGKEFKKLAIKRGEWITDDQLNRYLKGVYYAGKFIRETFQFADFFVQGRIDITRNQQYLSWHKN